MRKLIAMLLTTMSMCCGAEEGMDLLISPQEISEKVQEAALQIDKDYAGKPLTVLMVMKGAICVTSDLVRALHIPFQLDYVSASSYNRTTSGELKLAGLDRLKIEDRDVLLVDDIFETGQTLSGIIDQLKAKNPRSIKTLVLLVKDVPRKINYRPDYVLFDIDNHFVIGYGLDYEELFRGLPGIYMFKNDIPPF